MNFLEKLWRRAQESRNFSQTGVFAWPAVGKLILWSPTADFRLNCACLAEKRLTQSIHCVLLPLISIVLETNQIWSPERNSRASHISSSLCSKEWSLPERDIGLQLIRACLVAIRQSHSSSLGHPVMNQSKLILRWNSAASLVSWSLRSRDSRYKITSIFHECLN